MRMTRYAVALAIGAVLLAACGHPNDSSGQKAGSTGAKATTVQTDSVSGLGKVFADGQGLTLYHNTQESGGTIVCTGSCATTWPPYLVNGALPQAMAGVKGTFGTVTRPEGTTQLTFDGMPLYTYAGDSASGQANGQGIGGIWFAVGPKGSTSGSATSGGGSGGGGGGYGSGGGSGGGW